MNRSAIKTTGAQLIGAAVALIFTAGICHAQTMNLKPAPAVITIDGNAREWGDMPYTNDNGRISYTLSNDKDNLYLVIKTKDTVLQGDILGSGITFSIDRNGKKSTTFPANQLKDKSGYLYLNPTQVQIKAALTKYRKIAVEGFPAIADEQLSTANLYGIQIAMGYDDAGYLVYEEAIPLTLFQADDPANKEWAFTVKINGLESKQIAYNFVTNIFQHRSLSHNLTNEELQFNTRQVNESLAMITSSGGKSIINGINGRFGQSSNFNAKFLATHDIGHTSFIKIFPLTLPVEFWGKFILSKTP